jgi:hypothetical protein
MNTKERKEFHIKLSGYIRRHETMTYNQMSEILGISVATFSKVAITHGLRRKEKHQRFEVTDDLLRVLEQ